MSRFWHVHLSRWTMWDWFEWRGLCADDSYSCFGFIFKALDANLSLSFVPFFTVILSNSCQVIQFHPPKWCSWAINSDRPHSLSPCGTDDVLRAVEGGRGVTKPPICFSQTETVTIPDGRITVQCRPSCYLNNIQYIKTKLTASCSVFMSNVNNISFCLH